MEYTPHASVYMKFPLESAELIWGEKESAESLPLGA